MSAAAPRGVPAVESFTRRLAVVTGGGSGMGRELARRLAAAGCSAAACDWHQEEIAQAADRAGAVDGATISAYTCDVRDSKEESERTFAVGHHRCLRRIGSPAAPDASR